MEPCLQHEEDRRSHARGSAGTVSLPLCSSSHLLILFVGEALQLNHNVDLAAQEVRALFGVAI
jgi:hypothetical protein